MQSKLSLSKKARKEYISELDENINALKEEKRQLELKDTKNKIPKEVLIDIKNDYKEIKNFKFKYDFVIKIDYSPEFDPECIADYMDDFDGLYYDMCDLDGTEEKLSKANEYKIYKKTLKSKLIAFKKKLDSIENKYGLDFSKIKW